MKSLNLIIFFIFLASFAKADYSAHPVNKWMNGNCETTLYIITTGDAGPFTVDIEKEGSNIYHEENLPSDIKMVSIADYGQFTVTFTDAFGCSTEIIVDALCDCDDLEYNVTQPSCHLDNGSIEITSPMGAIMTSEWTQWPTGIDAPLNNALVANNLVPGIYVATFNISIPDPTSGDFISCEFEETFDLTDCNCEMELDDTYIYVEGTTACENPNGSIKMYNSEMQQSVLNYAGLISDLQFKWTDDAGTVLQVSDQFGNVGIDNLAEGFYHLTISDVSGCEVSKTFEIKNELDVEIHENITHPCNNLGNGSINSLAFVMYNESWIDQDFEIQWSTDENDTLFLIENLDAGMYSATFTDGISGCTYERTYTLENKLSTPINDIMLSELEPPKCEGKSTEGKLTIIGGQGPFEINWSPNFNQNNTKYLRFWESGTYQVTVDDYCDNSLSKTFEVIVPEVEYEEITNLEVDVVIDCEAYSGTTTLTFEGGKPPFKIYKTDLIGLDWDLLESTLQEKRSYEVPYDGFANAYKVEDGCGNERIIAKIWPPKCDLDLDIDVSIYRHCHPDRDSGEGQWGNIGNGAISVVSNGNSECDQNSFTSFSIVPYSQGNYWVDQPDVLYFDCLSPGVYQIFYEGDNCRSIIDEVEILLTGTTKSGCGLLDGNWDPGNDDDDDEPITCDDVSIVLDTYNGNGLFSGDIFYYGPSPGPLVTIQVEREFGGPIVHDQQLFLGDIWGVPFAVDISHEPVGYYDVIVILPDGTRCNLAQYSIEDDIDIYIDDPNFQTGNLCGFEVDYELDQNGDEVVDARLLLSHGLGAGDQVSIIGLGSEPSGDKSKGLHISFWQGDTSLSTWDCDGNGANTPSADPFTLVSDEPVRVEIRPYRYPNFDDECSANAKHMAKFELDCDDNLHDPNDDCNEFLVSNFGDEDYLVEHNMLSTNQNSVPPHVILSPLTMNGGVVSSNTIVSNNTTNFILGRDVLSTSNSFNTERLAYQSFNIGEDTLGDLQTLVDIAEAGSDTYAHFTFDTPFTDIPIILPTLVQVDGDQGLEIELKDVSRYGFKIMLRDVDNVLNGSKREVSFIAIEEGETSIGGRKVVVGKTLNDINHNWTNISFPNNSGQSFPENHMPYFFAFPQTSHGAGSPFVMYQNLSQNGVEINLVSADEYLTQGSFSNQEVGYLIFGVDMDCICDHPVTDIEYEMVSPNCGMNNGRFEFKPIGGTPPFDFKVNGSNYFANAEGSVVLEDLMEGTYNLEILDSKGCLYEEEIILVADELNLEDFQAENVECQGGEFNVTLNPLGGAPPFTYSWNNGNTTEELKNVGSGQYYVTVVDAEGCIGTRHFNLRNMYLSISKEDATCDQDNGSLTAHPIGIAPFEYLWSNGATTFKIDDLAPGTYYVTVTDAAGCTKSTIKTIFPDGQVDLDYAHPFCGADNGYIEIIVDGIAPISYIWNTGATTSKIENLAPGDYTVTATDASGCTSIKSVTLNNINAISLNGSGGNEGFNDGRYIPAGVTVNWSFNPYNVTDQLIISSDVNGIIINTGGVTLGQESCCTSNNCCSDFFLGDYINSPIDLIEGSGFVLDGNSNSNYCIMSGYLTGSFTTQSDSYISLEVIGANCGGNTAWAAAMSCSNTNSILAAMEVNMSSNDEQEQELVLSTEEGRKNAFSIFPNPANSILYVEFYLQTQDANLRIIDVHGKTILKSKIENTRETLDVSRIQNGIYIVVLESPTSTLSRKLLINR